MAKKRRRYIRRARKDEALPSPETCTANTGCCSQVMANTPVARDYVAPNLQTQLEEKTREVQNLQNVISRLDFDSNHYKDLLAEVKSEQRNLSDALANQIRDSLRKAK